MKNLALVLSGLVLGGALATVATRPVQAQGAGAGLGPGPSRAKWQQYCEPAASIQEASAIAAARGTDGWELLSFANGAMCFKRPALPGRNDVAWPGY